MFKIDLKELKRLSTYRGAVYHDGIFHWVYGSLILEDNEKDIYSIRVMNPKNEPPRYTDYVVKNKTIAPITEFKDLNGKDLFVGDVIDFVSMPGSPGYSRAIVLMEQGILKAQDQNGRSIHLAVIGDQFMIRGNYTEHGMNLLTEPAVSFLGEKDEIYLQSVRKFEAFRDDMIQVLGDHKATIMESEDKHFFKVDGALTSMVPVNELILDWTVKAIQNGKPRSMTVEDFKKGDLVTYVGKAFSKHTLKSLDINEVGRVKSVSDDLVYVAFNCGGEWENWLNYTGVGVHPSELVKGWKDEKADHYILTSSFEGKWGNEDQMTPSDVIYKNERLTEEGSTWAWVPYTAYLKSLEQV